MNVLLIYFLKVTAIQTILYLVYVFTFHRSGRHAINRVYLILALAGSFLIPVITLPDLFRDDELVENDEPIWYELTDITGFSSTETEFIPVERLNQSDYTIEFAFLVILLISSLLLIKLIHSHFQLFRLKGHSDEIVINGYKIYCSEIESPFSYFTSIFIPKSLLNSTSFDTIVEHELVHVKKLHSIDRILIEIGLSLFWFNPLLYLFRNRLIETHEFQADAEVISLKQDPIAYQEILFQQVNTQNAIASANYFKLNTIKTRIKMINKNKKLSKWYYLFILPAIAAITFSFANKGKSASTSLGTEIETVLAKVSKMSDLYTPSIMPCKETDLVRLTSGFGKRLHPILKVEKMHPGVDFSIPIGKEVIATANGTVKQVNRSETGFGNHLSIDHNGEYKTFYAQLSEIKVKAGQHVKRGDLIALTGNSGTSTGPHLHYEVRNGDGKALDPLDFINSFGFKPKPSEKSDKMKLRKDGEKLKVLIDPGHGGNDKGVSSTGFTEKEIALKVAKEVAEIFKDSDQVEIILTRDQDEIVTLKDRVNKSENADLFISLHVDNHANEGEDQTIAIYNDTNDQAEGAEYFGNLLKQEFSQLEREFKLGYTVGNTNGYYILQNSKAPAILLVMGYFSNPVSEKYLNSEEGMKEIAQKLSDAIGATL